MLSNATQNLSLYLDHSLFKKKKNHIYFPTNNGVFTAHCLRKSKNDQC